MFLKTKIRELQTYWQRSTCKFRNRKCQHHLRNCNVRGGFVISIELILVVVVVAIGLITATSAMRETIVSELSDVGGTLQDINQSFTINGVVGTSAVSAGANFLDDNDYCDNNGDVAGQADNGILFDCPPKDEGEDFSVSREDLNWELLFDGDANDTSPNGQSNDGTLQNGASIVGGQLVLDGVDDFVSFGNSTDINTGVFFERTIHIEFTADDVIPRQVIYQEGATARGINVYIENGLLYVGAWNIPETGFQPTFLSTPITAGMATSVTFVLDAGPGITPDGMSLYVNGSLVGTADASEMYSHLPANIGQAFFNTFFDGPVVGNGSYFGGTIDSLQLYSSALSHCEIIGL